ncbi:protein FAR1-RELATED SEQUENCE 5-like [Chenopodium quinoa]|uniref:protein FAR1-RELATED SEQUENCE 5-like n=1 Tax=Chenopodium quinoa TaxID=63459 RepID=UPI000B77273D|nr:protein FAR1-RELATED SEQUENCE 5-like [Chenopodium quinoa]
MTDDNSTIYHTRRVNELGRLQDVLWVDARSRVAYEEFGDVVCFDSTYLTNEYKLPFCNFVGVNHHGQTILFGCALVSREIVETFEWVFSNWLRCMGEKQPICILTDQDPTMRKALKATMKGTTHQWCVWHITQKFSKKLGKLPNYAQIHDDLENVIYDRHDCEEFESNWLEVIKKHELEDDEWLQGLYDERHMWVPAFMKHLFWAGMKTTQRVESIHRFFDGYLSKHTLLFEFVERYYDALEVRFTSEKKDDDNNERYVHQAYTDFPTKLVFQKIYTDAKFKEVQRECNRIIYVSGIHRKQISDSLTEHVLEDRVCCWYFECHGIICHHIIKVFEMSNYYEIPDKYILQRWRKDVIQKHTRVKVIYRDPSKTEEEKDSTPSTQRQGSCDGVQEDVPVKDPPLPKRLAHRTMDSRSAVGRLSDFGFFDCIEQLYGANVVGCLDQVPHTQSIQNIVPYRPQCVGGIQMLDKEGSIGYFTSVGGGAQ